MTACFSLWPVLMSYLESCISAAAVRGVHQRQRSFHQVADGERTGLDHLLSCWGELQGGCKQVFLSLAGLSVIRCIFLIICWLRNVFFPTSDWLDSTNGELGSKKHRHHNRWINKSPARVERHLLHPQILHWRPVWLPTLVWLQQKTIQGRRLFFFVLLSVFVSMHRAVV